MATDCLLDDPETAHGSGDSEDVPLKRKGKGPDVFKRCNNCGKRFNLTLRVMLRWFHGRKYRHDYCTRRRCQLTRLLDQCVPVTATAIAASDVNSEDGQPILKAGQLVQVGGIDVRNGDEKWWLIRTAAGEVSLVHRDDLEVVSVGNAPV